jgi:hypothetical protein
MDGRFSVDSGDNSTACGKPLSPKWLGRGSVLTLLHFVLDLITCGSVSWLSKPTHSSGNTSSATQPADDSYLASETLFEDFTLKCDQMARRRQFAHSPVVGCWPG